jgi:hypothetical protein
MLGLPPSNGIIASQNQGITGQISPLLTHIAAFLPSNVKISIF